MKDTGTKAQAPHHTPDLVAEPVAHANRLANNDLIIGVIQVTISKAKQEGLDCDGNAKQYYDVLKAYAQCEEPVKQVALIHKAFSTYIPISEPICHDPSPGPPHIVQQPPDSSKPPTLCRTSAHAPHLFWLALTQPWLTLTPPWLTPTAPWPTSTPSPQPLTLTLDLPNPKNHPCCSRSSPPIINSTPWFL
ncbi:hypothetical protein J132_02956 [Termitomyces sp. J132]|nr:hypothetical protein H2248_012486 [Termitomyces sp. 'cryptogamus']KNZ72445.1 hypothetical protein J132_02956 [Termitomyces sp. J132]